MDTGVFMNISSLISLRNARRQIQLLTSLFMKTKGTISKIIQLINFKVGT